MSRAGLKALIIVIPLVLLPRAALAGGLRVTASFLPVWIFAANVAGDAADVSLLVPTGTDVHEFSLRPADLKDLRQADLIVVNGGGLEAGLIERFGKDPRLVDASRGVPLIGTDGSPDPHFWLDPIWAITQVENVREAMAAADPRNRGLYEKNAASYIERLRALHEELKASLAPLRGQYLITFHASFAYFARRYGLRDFSLAGPDAEQPLPRRLTEVYDIARRQGVRAVFSEEGFSAASLGRLREDLGVRLCVLKTLETGRKEPEYYEDAMRENLHTLLDCLKEAR